MGEVNCEICSSAIFKYKCPTCCIKYCSSECYKSHKHSRCQLSNVQDAVEGKPSASKSFFFQTEDTVPPGTLKLLEECRDVVCLLKNKQLRQLLKTVDNSSDPSRTIQTAMQNPVFVNFVDQCLYIVDSVS